MATKVKRRKPRTYQLVQLSGPELTALQVAARKRGHRGVSEYLRSLAAADGVPLQVSRPLGRPPKASASES